MTGSHTPLPSPLPAPQPHGAAEPAPLQNALAVREVVSAAQPLRRRNLITALALLAALACAVLVLLLLPVAGSDPYTRATLVLQGSSQAGGRLFRLNCAGCHGLAAQGLVGPNLHGVERRKTDRELIQQVVSGRTPPMPRFQPDPQAMADLLAFLHSLP